MRPAPRRRDAARAGHAGWLLPLLLLAGLAAPARAQSFPPLTGRVVDAAEVLPADVESRLAARLAGLEARNGRQLVVATIPDLQGLDIADYGYQLGRNWGIGSKARNDGALLIVAPGERKLRIEVGYGLEGVLTDGLSSLIINQTIVPRLKAGDLPGGIEAGTDAIIAQLSRDDAEARSAAQAAQAQGDAPEDGFALLPFAFFFLIFFVIPFARTLYGRHRYPDRRHAIFLLEMLSNMPRGGSGSSGGGGGFSGGGGSFGGGGASGSW